MTYPVNPLVGVDVTKLDSTRCFTPGSEHMNEEGTTFQYCKNDTYTSIVPGLFFAIDPTNTLVSATASQYTLPTRFGVYQGASTVTTTSGSGGWFAVKGLMSVIQDANLTVGAKLYQDTTYAGAFSGTSTSACLMQGASAIATTTSSTLGQAKIYAIINLGTCMES